MNVDLIVEDPNPAWANWFEVIRSFLEPAVGSFVLHIEHVGSTAVSGLAAKPIIDIDMVVRSEDEFSTVIGALSIIGYEWVGNIGLEGREAFEAPRSWNLPPHHLYLVVENTKPHLDHVLLRDVLVRDDSIRDEYGALKRKNAEVAINDGDLYTALKASFIANILRNERVERGLSPSTYWDPFGEVQQ
jgi:GrpB-like predicted nucleotidyltransferase (UPF0157 family)